MSRKQPFGGSLDSQITGRELRWKLMLTRDKGEPSEGCVIFKQVVKITLENDFHLIRWLPETRSFAYL